MSVVRAIRSSVTGDPDATDDDLLLDAAPHPVMLAPATLKRRLVAADGAAIVLGLVAAFGAQRLLKPVPENVQVCQAGLACASLPVWLLACALRRLYTARLVTRFDAEVQRLLQASLLGVAGLMAIGFFVNFDALSRLWVVASFGGVFAFLIIERVAARGVFARLRRQGRVSRRVVFVGTNADAATLCLSLDHNPQCGYEVVGFAGDDPAIEAITGRPVLGDVDHMQLLLDAVGAGGVVIVSSAVSAETTNRLTRQLTDAGVHVELSSNLRDIDITRFRVKDLGGHPVLYVEPVIRDGWRSAAKRAFDVAFSLVALVLTSPVLLVAAIAIKFDSRGPVLFRQERVGLDGQRFNVLKLRTMCMDAEAKRVDIEQQNEADGPLFKIKMDPRVTRVGHLLRTLSVDEIPQFWNVLRNEMSVVGPRPALASEMEQWSELLHDRLRVKPGITGMWQVSGRSDTTFEQYQRLDLYYVDNWSLTHDVLIALKTLPAVLLRKGAK
jgi:exopolysaccharide biosynthesis polyprenyl glycosylphosphotransferase